jgi:glyoxylase-like metal-dependent hydrolase (beta-lactamase superfamily II)
MKRVAIALAVVITLLVVPVGAVMASTFLGNMPLEDGVALPGGALLVKDGYVALTVLPAGEKQVALIDCGNDDTGVAVLKALERRGLGPEAVKAIFLTHGHPDHTAACHLFKNAEVMALAAEAPIAAGELRTKGPLPSMMDLPVEKRVKVTRPLTDGESVNVGPLTVKVYAVPGHTQGSAVYLAGHTLYFGDSATSRSSGQLIGAPWVFSDDQVQNRASLRALVHRLRAEGAIVEKLAFAHSGPLDGLEALEALPP